MDEKTPSKKNPKNGPSNLSTGALVSLAMVAGAVVSLIVIYGTGGFNGNGINTLTQADNACPANNNALDSFMIGDIAAMAVRDEPNYIGDLAFNDRRSQNLTLSQTDGKIKLINLWATWCAPCREEMPWLDTLQRDKGGEDFNVVAISVDGGNSQKPIDFFKEIDIQHMPFYHDPSIEVFNALKRKGLALGLPVTLLVDENDCVIAHMNGPARWDSQDAYALIDAAIAGSE